MSKLPFFKKKKCSYLNNNSLSVLSAGEALSKFKRGEKLQNFPDVVTNTRIPNCISDNPKLLANTSIRSDSSQYATLFWSLVQI